MRTLKRLKSSLHRENMAEWQRGRRNVLQPMNDSELLKHYRLDKASIMFEVDLIRVTLVSPTQHSNAITPEIKVITLWYLATGKMQQCSSDNLGLSQPSISRVITQTLVALSHLHIVQQFISFPLDVNTVQALKRAFMHIAGFPGIVGIIHSHYLTIWRWTCFSQVILVLILWTYRAHKKTQSMAARGIGQLKRRFHVLHGEVRLTPAKVCQVITACAILHNICKARQISEPPENGHNDDEEDDEEDCAPQCRDLKQWASLQSPVHIFAF